MHFKLWYIFLVVCRVLGVKLVSVTSSEGFLVIYDNRRWITSSVSRHVDLMQSSRRLLCKLDLSGRSWRDQPWLQERDRRLTTILCSPSAPRFLPVSEPAKTSKQKQWHFTSKSDPVYFRVQWRWVHTVCLVWVFPIPVWTQHVMVFENSPSTHWWMNWSQNPHRP